LPCITLLLLLQVWEVQWGRDGYKGTPKVMDLKGHKSQVGTVAGSMLCCCLMNQQHHVLLQSCLTSYVSYRVLCMLVPHTFTLLLILLLLLLLQTYACYAGDVGGLCA
jgi:hypothetical protein